MHIEHVVMNASPLICLFESGLIHLLPKLFKEIIVPDIVCNEIVAKGKIDNASRLLHAYNWLKQVKDIPLLPSVLAWDLGKGESAVLSYAIQHSSYWAGIDDREARVRLVIGLSAHWHRGSHSVSKETWYYPKCA